MRRLFRGRSWGFCRWLLGSGDSVALRPDRVVTGILGILYGMKSDVLGDVVTQAGVDNNQ